VKLEEQAAQGAVKELPAPDGTTNKLGIITLPGFYADMEGARRGAETRSASADVRRILEDLKGQGVKGILVDLRNNGGGSLTEAVKITGLFITSGPVVQVKDQHDVVVLRDTDPSEVYDAPVVVLVNRMSASASEIFAGALQDYGRAVIVGDSRTHGKGTVQSLVPVSQFDPKSGSLKVTSASFYRITGASTQEKGVDTDIAVPSPLDVMEIGEEYLDFRLPWSKTDPAESRALNTGNVIGDLLLWGLGGMTYSNQATADIRPIVEQVKKMSEDRRSKDQRFALRNQLIKRFADKVKETEVSLNIKERRVEAKEEMRLLELQDEALAGETPQDGSSSAEAKRGADIVIDEAERILNDMTVLEKAEPR
jgi:carboxyl-terminal processing protease